jgi:choline dehydrogenase
MPQPIHIRTLGQSHTQDLPVLPPAHIFKSLLTNSGTAVRWAFYVNHTSNATQALRYNHLTWLMPDGSFWVGSGARAPSDAKLLGVYYPRGNNLGGSAVINAMVTILPNDADWDHIANLTGDVSWS